MRASPSALPLEVRDLRTYFFTEEGVARAVDGVSFSVEAGRTLGLVGESGCGKSVSALSILRLITPPGKIVGGRILVGGDSVLDLSERQMMRVRGGRVSMVFQEPMTSLNPVFTIGHQIAEAILAHERVSRTEAWNRAVDMIRKVRIPAAESRAGEYPHQMSGGMRQRAMVAMALACRPSLLIADEPTTALDVTIQAQIMELLAELQRELGMAILLITHNLGLVAQVADDIAVMYASRIAERAPVGEIFSRPLHPYTHGLMTSIPRLGMDRTRPLNVIPGGVPNPLRFPTGCKFHPRCPVAVERCRTQEPPLGEVRPRHHVACHLAEDGQAPLELPADIAASSSEASSGHGGSR